MNDKHFTKVPNKGITVTPEALLIYAYIRSYVRSDKLVCFPSLDTIKDRTKIGITSIKRYIKELEDNKYIEVTKEKGSVNKYIFRDLKKFEPVGDPFLDNLILRFKLKSYVLASEPYMKKNKIEGYGLLYYSNSELSKIINMPESTISKLNRELIKLGLMFIRDSEMFNEAGFKRKVKVFNLEAMGQSIIWQIRKNTEDIQKNTEDIKKNTEDIEDIKKEHADMKKELAEIKAKLENKEIENKRLRQMVEVRNVVNTNKIINALKNQNKKYKM